MNKSNRIVIVNASLLVGLLASHEQGASLEIVLVTGVCILAFANGLIYWNGRR